VELLPDVLRGAGTQAIEDVVVPLLSALSADPRLLQQVMRHKAAHDGVLTGNTRAFNPPAVTHVSKTLRDEVNQWFK